jgi:hypothetical protein
MIWRYCNEKNFIGYQFLMIAASMVVVYLLGFQHGQTGESVNITKEAIAAKVCLRAVAHNEVSIRRGIPQSGEIRIRLDLGPKS